MRYLYDDFLTVETSSASSFTCHYQNLPDFLRSQFPMRGIETLNIETSSRNMLELPTESLVYMLRNMELRTTYDVEMMDSWIDTGYTGNYVRCMHGHTPLERPISIHMKWLMPGQHRNVNFKALFLFSTTGINFGSVN